MSFSFNPGQATQAGEPMSGGNITAPNAPSPEVLAAVPDSPFLFMQQRGQELSIMAYIQIVLIMLSVLAIAVSITLFMYSSYLTSTIATKKEQLLGRDATFKDFPLEDMKRLSLRFSVLGEILKNYVSVRSPLKMLEDVVEKQVVFDKFVLLRPKTTEYSMSFTVVTGNYKALIQQLDSLNLSQYSKIVPTTKIGSLVDVISTLKVEITAPVFAQGILPEDVVFVPISGSTSSSLHSTSTTGATSTP